MKDDLEDHKSNKYITNALLRENGQRNYIMNGIIKQIKMIL